MRNFIAIEPPEEIKEHLASLKIDLPARWTSKENIHLTLFFIGQLDEELIEGIKSALKMAVKKSERFNLEVNGLTYAPPKSRPPKMIWAVIEDSELLKELKKRICEALGRESGEFLPHMTLARINGWKFRQLEEEEIPNLPEVNISFEVNSVCLMESKIVKGRVKYQLIERFKLK